jgi:hypothetical protein
MMLSGRGNLRKGSFLGALASRRRVPVFGSRLAGETPALPGGSWKGYVTLCAPHHDGECFKDWHNPVHFHLA